MKQIDLDQKQVDLESIIFPEYLKRWELVLTLAFITESLFQHIPMCISSYSYSNFRLIKNNFLFLETYIIISHSLVDFLEVDEHFLEIWWTFFLAVNFLIARLLFNYASYVISRKNLPKLKFLSCYNCMT